MSKVRHFFTAGLILLAWVMLAACEKTPPAPQLTATPSPSATPFQPSPTPIPLAAVVNGTPVPLAVFQAEYARFRAAQNQIGTELATPEDAPQWVLDDMIDRMLLAEAAYQQGYVPPDDNALWAQAVQQAGGEEALQDYLARQGYSRSDFLAVLKQDQAVAWMVNHLAEQVPRQMEQVHARQILVYNKQEAESVLARVRQGEDFVALAAAYDPQGRGDLGWFPQGYLTQKALEEAAFALEPGQVSEIVQTPLGYHILRVESRAVHPLSPDALRRLQIKAVETWLQQRRAESQIRILLTPTP